MNKLSVNVILAIVPLSAAIGAVETVDVTPPEWKCRNGRIYSGNEAIIEFKGEGLRIEARNSLEAPWRRIPGTRVELKKPAWYQIRAVDSSGDERIVNISLLGEALKEEWRCTAREARGRKLESPHDVISRSDARRGRRRKNCDRETRRD